MNKRYVENDAERDQSHRLQHEEMSKEKARQKETEEHGRKQHGGWSDDEAKRRTGQSSDVAGHERTVDEP